MITQRRSARVVVEVAEVVEVVVDVVVLVFDLYEVLLCWLHFTI
jgi:hypothetical protein